MMHFRFADERKCASHMTLWLIPSEAIVTLFMRAVEGGDFYDMQLCERVPHHWKDGIRLALCIYVCLYAAIIGTRERYGDDKTHSLR